MGYQPIGNYGIIGNMHTTALVGLNGSIDWFCFPRHDSPSLFAALLDQEKGGHFQIHPLIEVTTHKQMYWLQTNILVTRFLSPSGVSEVIDFMPVGLTEHDRGYRWLVRRVRMVRRSMPFQMECYPAFNYARDRHKTALTPEGAVFESPDLRLNLITDVPLEQNDRGVSARFTLNEGEEVTFVLRELDPTADYHAPVEPEEAHNLFVHTVKYWQHWLSQCNYKGRWREMVERSALVLKLLVEALTRAGRIDPERLIEARLKFEEMLSYATGLGLYAEEIGSSGESMGNFPQAFTHLALISAAWNLNRVLETSIS